MATPSVIAPEILARLADIVEPPPVDNWPPAPGWVVATILLTLLVLYVLFRHWQRWQRNAYRRAALSALRGLIQVSAEPAQPAERLPAILAVLRRCALAAYPREMIAPLHRLDWLQFLQHSATIEAPTSCHRLLCDGPYLSSDACRLIPAQEVALLHEFVEQWIRRHRRFERLDTGPAPSKEADLAHDH